LNTNWPFRLSLTVLLAVSFFIVSVGCGTKLEGNDVAATVGGVEAAAAVAEGAVGGGEGDELERVKVEGADVGDGVGDLLAVGADVLDGRAADSAGDTGEAFDAADSLLADLEDEAVPVGAGGDGVVDEVACAVGLGRGVDGDVEDEAVEAAVADEEVAATA